MQVFLKKNSITPKSFNKDVKPMPDDLVVMYVVAPGDKLAKTLKDVDQHRELFSNWTAQAPLQLAGNPEVSVPETAKKEIVGRGLPQEQKNENLKQGSAEADAETSEVQVVLDAYAQRNGFGNAIMSNSSRSSNAVSGGNLGGVSNSQLPQNSNLVPEKRMNERASRTANLADQRLQSRALGNSQPGYDLVRLNNPIHLNNDQSSGMSNTTQLVLPRMESARKQLAFNDAEKATRESNPRALRMLFVLHPQGDGMPAVEPQ
jgi:hypothetical protein